MAAFSFAMIQRRFVLAMVLCLVAVHMAVGNPDFGDKGGVIRFHTDVAGYDVCTGPEWDKVLDLLEDFIPRSFFDQRVRGLRLGNRELQSCKNCGNYCYYTGSGCPKLAKRRLDEASDKAAIPQPPMHAPSPAPKTAKQPQQPRALQTTPVAAPKRAPTRAPRTKRPTRRPTRRPTSAPTRNCASGDECCIQLKEFEKKMGELQQQVGGTCRTWVGSRDIFCAVDTHECKPTNVDLLGDKVVNQMPSGTTPTEFCKSHNVSFRAATEFFLGYVTFVVRNASTNAIVLTTKYDEGPFYYMGVDANGVMATTRFAVGNYKLEVRSDYSPQAITVPFRVNDC